MQETHNQRVGWGWGGNHNGESSSTPRKRCPTRFHNSHRPQSTKPAPRNWPSRSPDLLSCRNACKLASELWRRQPLRDLSELGQTLGWEAGRGLATQPRAGELAPVTAAASPCAAWPTVCSTVYGSHLLPHLIHPHENQKQDSE